MKKLKRQSNKRSIRWTDTDNMDTIQEAVDRINDNSAPGQRTTFNSFVAESSLDMAKQILRTPKRLLKILK